MIGKPKVGGLAIVVSHVEEVEVVEVDLDHVPVRGYAKRRRTNIPRPVAAPSNTKKKEARQ